MSLSGLLFFGQIIHYFDYENRYYFFHEGLKAKKKVKDYVLVPSLQIFISVHEV